MNVARTKKYCFACARSGEEEQGVTVVDDTVRSAPQPPVYLPLPPGAQDNKTGNTLPNSFFVRTVQLISFVVCITGRPSASPPPLRSLTVHFTFHIGSFWSDLNPSITSRICESKIIYCFSNIG